MMDNKPKKDGGKKKPLPRFFLSFLISLILIISSVSAMQVVDYEDFDDIPIGTTGNNLTAYGFLNISGGSAINLSNGAIFPEGDGGSFIFCTDIPKRFNLVDESYYATYNGSSTGVPFNMTYRYRIRASPNSAPYISNQYGQVIPGDHRGTGIGATIIPTIRLYGNVTSQTRVSAWQNTSKGYVLNVPFPIDYTYHDIQVDYWMIQYPSAIYKQVYNVSFSVDGIYQNSSLVDLATSGTIAQRINVTLFDNVNLNYCFVVDDLVVIMYDFGEPFLSPSEDIPDYLIDEYNQLPLFSILTKDENNQSTDLVGVSTSSCSPYNIGTEPFLPAGCNPLYITFPLLSDPENDTATYSLNCFESDANIVYTDDFRKTSQEINEIYIEDCDWMTEYYTRTGSTDTTTGIRFRDDLNCTTPALKSFFSDDPDIPAYLSSSMPYLFEWDITPIPDATYNFEFVDFNIDTMIEIGWLYNTSSSTSYLMIDGVIEEDFSEFDGSDEMSWRIFFDDATEEATIRIQQGSDAVYSRPYAVDWDYPMYFLLIRGENATTNYVAKDQLFGNYSVRGIDADRTFNDISGSVLNCSSSAYDSYDGVIYVSDSAHGENFLNFERFRWMTDPTITGGGFIEATNPDAVESTFDLLFMGSDFLKYLFALILFLGIVFGSFAGASYLGNAMAGVFVAMFAGVACIFFLILFGILPVWIGVVIFFLMAIIGVMAFRSGLIGSAGEG